MRRKDELQPKHLKLQEYIVTFFLFVVVDSICMLFRQVLLITQAGLVEFIMVCKKCLPCEVCLDILD